MLDPAFYHLTGTSTGRMSQTRSDWPEDMVKKVFAPRTDLKYFAAPLLDNNDEWYTIREEGTID